jgi:integrase
MGDLPSHVTSYRDRHGSVRYRFRTKGLPQRALPGEPGSEAFQKAYAQALAGVPAKPRRAPRFEPRTLAAAWALVRASIEWKQLKPISQKQQTNVAERFLALPITEGEMMTFGRMPFTGIKRFHVKAILGRYERPHAAAAVLALLRKLSIVALDANWIENDPTHRIKFRPKLKGHRAWTDAELEQYEARWEIGTRERLGYALALYTGQRRGDVAAFPWRAYDGEGVTVTQEKTDAPLWVPTHPELQTVLAATEQTSPFILTSSHGTRFTRESFGNLMADAIERAGLPAECRLHGLRKAAGRCLAEAGATTRMIMAVLGHKTLKEAERYTREASQKKLSRAGIDQWAAKPRLVVVK